MPRGRPPGSGGGPGSLGPRAGSRPWHLLRLEPGESLFLEVKTTVAKTMAQIGADLARNDLTGKVTQTLILGVNPTTREVIELIQVYRKED